MAYFPFGCATAKHIVKALKHFGFREHSQFGQFKIFCFLPSSHQQHLGEMVPGRYAVPGCPCAKLHAPATLGTPDYSYVVSLLDTHPKHGCPSSDLKKQVLYPFSNTAGKVDAMILGG